MTTNRMAQYFILIAVVVIAAFSGYYYGHRPAAQPGSTSGQSSKSEYTCPMHPFIVKDKPGTCPICAMELVRKVDGVNLDQDLKGKQHVALSPSQQIMANLATFPAAIKPFSREIKSTGIVAYNQERQGKVSAWVAGRLDRLPVNSVGSAVRKGVPVAEVYSVDLYNAQVQYLLAYKTIKVLNSSIFTSFPTNTQLSLGDAYERLRQLGFREEQFSRLQKVDKPTITVPIYSPFSGVVTEKLVREGQFVNIGDPLFSIADLSLVWVELEVFESDLSLVKVGQNVTIHSRSYPGEIFQGKVKLIYPFLDAKTRTVKLRVEIPNTGLKLKPEMYVQGTISVRLADALLVPTSAVMDTGVRQVVWVESRPGVFQPRNVKIGIRSGKEVQILSGLKQGEKVATSGGYLIDSEAQLSRGADQLLPPATPPVHQLPSAQPVVVPARNHDLDMKEMKMDKR